MPTIQRGDAVRLLMPIRSDADTLDPSYDTTRSTLTVSFVRLTLVSVQKPISTLSDCDQAGVSMASEVLTAHFDPSSRMMSLPAS